MNVTLKVVNRDNWLEALALQVYPDNVTAYQLYRSVGFVDTGGFMGDERILMLPVSSA
ncbi:N-acetyltransferase [Brevibacillus migulae]|uniref:hypothetical protein n=1 Tax=Brevibacillus migulae TaxID=1644114 RepID=UPI001431CA6E|nr:hypothetical protein [Brevibacillus migulae]